MNSCTKPVFFLIFTANTKMCLAEYIGKVLIYNHMSSTINTILRENTCSRTTMLAKDIWLTQYEIL